MLVREIAPGINWDAKDYRVERHLPTATDPDGAARSAGHEPRPKALLHEG